jgi:hypothetical protein
MFWLMPLDEWYLRAFLVQKNHLRPCLTEFNNQSVKTAAFNTNL